MNLKKIPLCLVCLFFYSQVFPQLTESEKELIAPSLLLSPALNYSLEFNLKGLGSTGEKLPFWLYHNQRGRVSSETNISTWLSGKAVTFLSRESFIILGAGALYQDGISDGLKVDEIYAHFQNPHFYITAGRKHQPELYNGLSASNKSILWSINARPIPGLQVGTTNPVFFNSERQGFGFEASWDEYFLGNDRYVKGARLHHKNFRLVYRKGDWQGKIGVQHYAQWGGTHPRHGKNPSSLEDYLSILTGQEGGAGATISDQLNALGNHLGGYEIYLSKEFDDFRLKAFYNHLFEDGSGQRWRNKVDGRYAIYFEKHKKEQLINSMMLELYYTEHQSHTINAVHKWDNYFNNGFYRSGWTYEGRLIGAPFFTENPNGIGIINNKFRAYHFGMGGMIKNGINNYPYKLMLSYSHNDGTAFKRFRPKQDVFYVDYKMTLYHKFVELNFQIGAEYNSYASPIYGAGIHLRKKF